MLITSSVKSNKDGPFLVTALIFLKFTQIMNFPFFSNTITIGDSQVASSIGLIKFATNNLSISYLIMVA
jgi:hypothetical protein